MQLILAHENADFDAVASQLAAHKLNPDSVPVLARRLNRNVEQFLMLYWSAFPFVRPQDWQRRRIEEVLLVDTQALNTIRGMVKNPTVHVIDHHMDHQPRAEWTYQVEAVGATTTLLVEQMQSAGLNLTAEEATLLLLGIYEDTGSLTYDTTTPRDILAAAWLLKQGGIMTVVRRFLNIPLSEAQQALYSDLYNAAEWHEIRGQTVLVAAAEAPENFEDEIASVAHRLRETLMPSGLLVLVQLHDDVQLVARSTTDQVDVSIIAKALGGGGHSRAAAARLKDTSLTAATRRVEELLPEVILPVARVADLMSHGVQTVSPTLAVHEAASRMQRFGYEGYPVFDEGAEKIVGLLTRRAVDRAMSHDMGNLPVDRIMKAGAVTVRPSDSIELLQQRMLSAGWGQIPVLPDEPAAANGRPIGIVTRTDLLNYLFQTETQTAEPDMRQLLLEYLSPVLWQMVLCISEKAAELSLPLYFVGGLVRDLLLGQAPTDLDMVVEGDAIKLARSLQAGYGGEIRTHKRFGTAKWLLTPAVWQALLDDHALVGGDDEEMLAGVPESIDFVTARAEFYAEPTALPQVEHGSIKLDLHRRDFAINTLAVRLDGAFLGQLLDFYGGQRDLENGIIRVLHSLSFVDDPTRILRAVRLEQRLDFSIEARTKELIADALPLLDRVSGSRIRHEFELAFREENPAAVVARLEELNVLEHIDKALTWSEDTAAIYARVPAVLADPDWSAALSGDSPEFIYFALWMSGLETAVQQRVMRRLRVRKATRADINAVNRALALLAELPAKASPSQVERALRDFTPRVLLVVRLLRAGEPAAEMVTGYYKEWRYVKTAVTGDDLRQMGLKPGPQYAVILDKLLAARLDGQVSNEQEERAFVEQLIASS